MAPPSKMNAERTERIRQAILAGGSVDDAASRGNVSSSTYYEWAARGRAALEATDQDLDAVSDDDRPFAEFAETVDRARHDWELSQVAQIQHAGQGRPYETIIEKQVLTKTGEIVTLTEIRRGIEHDWRALAWILEHRNPRVYGRATRVEHSGPEGAPIEVNVDDLVARAEVAIDELAARRERQAG